MSHPAASLLSATSPPFSFSPSSSSSSSSSSESESNHQLELAELEERDFMMNDAPAAAEAASSTSSTVNSSSSSSSSKRTRSNKPSPPTHAISPLIRSLMGINAPSKAPKLAAVTATTAAADNKYAHSVAATSASSSSRLTINTSKQAVAPLSSSSSSAAEASSSVPPPAAEAPRLYVQSTVAQPNQFFPPATTEFEPNSPFGYTTPQYTDESFIAPLASTAPVTAYEDSAFYKDTARACGLIASEPPRPTNILSIIQARAQFPAAISTSTCTSANSFTRGCFPTRTALQRNIRMRHVPNWMKQVHHYESRVFNSQFSHDGNTLCITTQDRHIRLFEVEGPGVAQSASCTDSSTGIDDNQSEETTYAASAALSSNNPRLFDLRTLDCECDAMDSLDAQVECICELPQTHAASSPYSPQGWPCIKDVLGRNVGWSIVDTDWSHDDKFIVYSTWSPFLQLLSTSTSSSSSCPPLHEALDLCPASGSRFGVFSLEFSPDDRELIAGASDRHLYLYDIARAQRTLRVPVHSSDVNGVCFAEEGSSSVFLTAGDDSLIKIWDRRCLRVASATNAGSGISDCVGMFLGHTQGITSLQARGDGRHFVSNCKDQTCKIWDMRRMSSSGSIDASTFARDAAWDYRWPNFQAAHPHLPPGNNIPPTNQAHNANSLHNNNLTHNQRGRSASPVSSSTAAAGLHAVSGVNMTEVATNMAAQVHSLQPRIAAAVATMVTALLPPQPLPTTATTSHSAAAATSTSTASNRSSSPPPSAQSPTSSANTGLSSSASWSSSTSSSVHSAVPTSSPMAVGAHSNNNNSHIDNSPHISRTQSPPHAPTTHPFPTKPTDLPPDHSLMTFTGHRVLETLIRAYFSPMESTGQRYVVSGSQSGAIHIWDVLSGESVQTLSGHYGTVRDVSWHPREPILMSASWDCSLGRWECNFNNEA